MEIEIVGFFPFLHKPKKRTTKGTLHIYLPEYKMDIRGCFASCVNGKFFIALPHHFSYDFEEKKVVNFPVVSFSDPALYNDLKRSLIKAGSAYIHPLLKTLSPCSVPKTSTKREAVVLAKEESNRTNCLNPS